jgi:hypothetical protein
MKHAVYIVYASTGEYSDRRDWNIVAFDTEQAARDCVRDLERESQIQGVAHTNGTFKWEEQEMQVDYTGIDFYYSEVELRIKYL